MKENTRKNENNPFADAPVIFSYTRAQAIEDGVLVDLTEWAKETGFRIPVACTCAVWNGYIVPSEDTREFGQSERGRAHDLAGQVQNPLVAGIRGQGRKVRVVLDLCPGEALLHRPFQPVQGILLLVR